MSSRGPDGHGLWTDERRTVALAHRRLSIIDLSAAANQPMEVAGVHITFNGEIFNFRELRSDLERRGASFRTNSDTEVLLQMYRAYGRDMVSRLRGMFAFAIWDTAKRELLLARDAFGIKPLYYFDDGSSLRFASQVKALLAGGAVSRIPDAAGHVGYFLWGFVPEPFTLYKEIKALPAGHILTVSLHGGRTRIEEYFSVRREFEANGPQTFASRNERIDYLKEAFDKSIKRHLIADVPVGIFLSSGADSVSIAMRAAASAEARLGAVTLGFKDQTPQAFDESGAASRIAARIRLNHSVAEINASDFLACMDHLRLSMDQPSIDGVNSYLVSRAAAQGGMKVALSGLGGDELLSGYPSFSDLPRSVRAFSPLRSMPLFGKGFRAATARMISLATSPKYASVIEFGGTMEGAYLLRRGLYMPWELGNVLDDEIAIEGLKNLQTLPRLRDSLPVGGTDTQKVAALELAWYMRNQLLRDSDWAGMAHSLEIRVPFVDVDLFRSLARMHGPKGEVPTKSELLDACVPTDVKGLLAQKKTGFAIPIDRWVKQLGLVDHTERGMRGWARTVYQWHWPTASKHAKRRVLVFRIGNLGDSLVAMPAIGEVRRQLPEASLALLSNRHSSESKAVSSWDVLGPTGWFDNQFSYDSDAKGLKAVCEVVRLTREIRRYRPTEVVNLSPKRSAGQARRDEIYFRRILGIPIRGASNVPAIITNGHSEPEWKRLKRVVGGDAPVSFALPIRSAERARAESVLVGVARSGGFPVIAIGPGSKMQAKRWPTERFEELGLRLLAQYPKAMLLVLGGPEDRALGEALCQKWGERCLNLAGHLSIYGSAALLERCHLYVGNDTGTMHLAAMVGTRCVAIFSARDVPGAWDPFGQYHTILRRQIECSGCMLETCVSRQNECLRLISVGDVLESVTNQVVLVQRAQEAGEFKHTREGGGAYEFPG